MICSQAVSEDSISQHGNAQQSYSIGIDGTYALTLTTCYHHESILGWGHPFETAWLPTPDIVCQSMGPVVQILPTSCQLINCEMNVGKRKEYSKEGRNKERERKQPLPRWPSSIFCPTCNLRPWGVVGQPPLPATCDRGVVVRQGAEHVSDIVSANIWNDKAPFWGNLYWLPRWFLVEAVCNFMEIIEIKTKQISRKESEKITPQCNLRPSSWKRTHCLRGQSFSQHENWKWITKPSFFWMIVPPTPKKAKYHRWKKSFKQK